MHAKVGLIALVTVLAACATPGASGPDMPSGVTTSRTDAEVRTAPPPPSVLEFPRVSPDSLWKLLPKTFEFLRIEAGVIDARARIYGNYGIVMTTIANTPVRTMFRCANEGSGPSGASQVRITFDVAASPRVRSLGGTELVVQTRASGTTVDASRSGKVDCVSTGALEQKLKLQIEALINP